MKRICFAVLVLAICFADSAFAGGPHGGGFGHRDGVRQNGGARWAPAIIIGGIGAYALTRPYGYFVPPPVYYASSPCHVVPQHVYDRNGYPVYDAYGRPVTHMVQVCPRY